MEKKLNKCIIGQTSSGNPFLAPWERIPDGELRVFTDPNTGKQRLYVYGSHDTIERDFCGYDHVVWSASVDDLTNWRHDGVAFHINQLDGLNFIPENGTQITFHPGQERLYAPDVIYHPQRKTYFMFVFTSDSQHIFAAESDRPEGPYTNPIYIGSGFDPAVLVDDEKDENGNQKVYLYWSVESERSAYVCELDPITLKKIDNTLHVPVGHSSAVDGNDTMPHRNLAPFYFFEGPSIRKVGAFYVLSYAKTDDRPGIGSLAEIGYAYSDNPYGDPRLGSAWQFGGVIIDNRGEVIQDPYSFANVATYKGGNNHGGMIDVNGQWYQIYHRWTGVGPTRQAMAEAIHLRIEEEKLIIEQAEVTSQGFQTAGLNPYESQYAISACFGLGSYTFDVNNAQDFDPDSVREDRYPVTNLKNHSWLGYKYFHFHQEIDEGEQLYLTLSLKDLAVGTINIYAADPKESYFAPEHPRTRIGAASLDGTNVYHEILVPVSAISGRKAIYLEFCSDEEGNVCELNKLRFTVGKGHDCFCTNQLSTFSSLL